MAKEIEMVSGSFVQGKIRKSSKQTSRLQPETGQSKATNLETQEQTKRIEIYYSQITNYDLLNWFK